MKRKIPLIVSNWTAIPFGVAMIITSVLLGQSGLARPWIIYSSIAIQAGIIIFRVVVTIRNSTPESERE